MGRGFNGTTDLASRSLDLSAYNVLTFSWWQYITTYGSAASFPSPWGHNNGSTNASYAAINSAWSGQVGKSVVGFGNAAASKFLQNGFNQPSTGAWHNLVWTADRVIPQNVVWVDGVLQSLNTVASTYLTGETFGNGALSIKLGNTQACSLADFAIFSGYLGADAARQLVAAKSLAAGVHPLEVPGTLVDYWPLWGDSPESNGKGNQQNLTLTGSAVVNGPPIRSFLFLTRARPLAVPIAAAGAAPTNTVAPVASGAATVGSVVSTTDGTWTGSPTFTYQWQRDTGGNLSFSNIGAATSSTYTLVDADDGNKVRCVVTGTNGSGSATGNSNALGLVTEPVPVNTVAPAVTGTATVGQVLTCSTGTWTHQGGSVATYAYQWQRDTLGSGSYSNIGAATSSTYTLVDADDTCHVRCVVTATNSGGAGTPANSNAAGAVVESGVPTSSVAPTVSGSAPQGSTLSASTGTWAHTGNSTTYAYQWTRDGANIGGATSATYVTQAGDVGHAVGCKVTPTNDAGAGSAQASSNTVTVTAAVSSGLRVIERRRRSL